MSTLTIEALNALFESIGVEQPVTALPGSDRPGKPLDISRAYLSSALEQALPDHASNANDAVQVTSNIDLGDLCVILPKLDHTCDPDVLGVDLMQKFPKTPLFALPIPEGPQLRFFLQQSTLAKWLLPYILDRGPAYGLPNAIGGIDTSSQPRQHVIIESSSPNIADEFKGTHLRSTVLGAQLANCYQAYGWKVTKLNYLGDWGKDLGLLGAGFERFGSQQLLETDPVTHLHEVYQKTLQEFLPEKQRSRQARDEHGDAAAAIVESTGLFAERNEFFKRMQAGDSKALDFVQRFRKWSIDQYVELYDRLGVDFDKYTGESQVAKTAMDEVLRIMEDKGLLEDSGGARAINLKAHGGRHGTAIIMTREGSSTYLLRDIAAVIERHREYAFDKMLYVVAADSNKTHFVRLFKILELMGMKDIAEKLHHVSFSENSHMSSQHDEQPTLRSVLDRCEEAMTAAVSNETARPSIGKLKSIDANHLCSAAIFAHASSVRCSANLSFDAEHLASSDRGSALDLLQCYERLQNSHDGFSKLTIYDQTPSTSTETQIPQSTEKSELLRAQQEDAREGLLRLLARFPEALEAALNSNEPYHIATYLNSLISFLKLWFPDQTDFQADDETQENLLRACGIVVGTSLRLLGVARGNRNRDSGIYLQACND